MEEPKATVRRGFRVRGRVQGVGFRMWIRHRAQALGLRGTVRNAPDGAVEVQAEGPVEAIRRLRALLLEGPPTAQVERVEDLPADEGPLPIGFEVVP